MTPSRRYAFWKSEGEDPFVVVTGTIGEEAQDGHGVDGPSISICKVGEDKLTVDDLINFGSITPQMAEFLEACVGARLNIVVSGGTGSGKTTLLNILSSFISGDQSIVTVRIQRSFSSIRSTWSDWNHSHRILMARER